MSKAEKATKATKATKEVKGQTIKIDGKDYALADLNDEAKNQLTNLSVTDQEIARLQTLLAITQTARAAYARALSEALPKEA